MPLPLPRLDDRTFDDMVADAEALVRRRCPAWTDFTPGDPGITLLEAFAYLTDVLLYRVNRIPEKVHIAMLNLLGVAPLTPAAATVQLDFTRDFGLDQPLSLPAGLRVADKSGAVEFATVADATLAATQATATIAAVHAEFVAGELLGTGTGDAGQTLRLRRPPVLRPLGGIETMALCVEAGAAEPDGRVSDRAFGGKSFVLWQEVENFVGLDPAARAYVLDRSTGNISFAPARRGGQPVAAVPEAGREIRAWYRRGGGRAGNVAPGVLTVLKVPVPGLTVSNAARATGGEDGETLAEAVARGRDAVGACRTAVTARDFERAAQNAGGVARARAYARRDRWLFAEPGVVEVQIVPAIDTAALPDFAVTLDVLAAHATADLQARLETELAGRRPIGVRTLVSRTRCRPVAVTATVVAGEAEDIDALHARLLGRLNVLLSPTGDWPFGRTLRASDVFETMLREPGIRYVERLRLTIEAGPETDIRGLLRDPNLPRTFFAATGQGLFRTLDLAASWTLQQDGQVIIARADPATPGLLATVLENDKGDLWTVTMSRDGGESWVVRDRIQGERVYDAAWITRDGRPLLLLATRQALRALAADGDGGSVNVNPLLRPGATAVNFNGFFAIASARHPSGITFVALAARDKAGVLTSVEGSQAGSFQMVPNADGQDVRVLAFQRDGDRIFLWAGMAAEAGADGAGMMRIEARADGIDPAGWVAFGHGWKGGSCQAVDFGPGTVAAATNRAGILVLEPGGTDPAWRGAALDCGLPINTERSALQPVTAVAAAEGDGGLILAGTGNGIFASTDTRRYGPVGQTQSTESAPLPPYWLYCAGAHELTLSHEAGAA